MRTNTVWNKTIWKNTIWKSTFSSIAVSTHHEEHLTSIYPISMSSYTFRFLFAFSTSYFPLKIEPLINFVNRYWASSVVTFVIQNWPLITFLKKLHWILLILSRQHCRLSTFTFLLKLKLKLRRGPCLILREKVALMLLVRTRIKFKDVYTKRPNVRFQKCFFATKTKLQV